MTYTHMLLGFIAGALATFTAHELISYVLLKLGVFPRKPWSLDSAPVTGVPQIFSDMFWGGLWGIVFAALVPMLPGGGLITNGLVFGILGPALIGVFLLVPLITRRFPIFFGGDAKLLASVLLILAGYGAALGYFYGAFTGL